MNPVQALYYWLIKKHDGIEFQEWHCWRCDVTCWGGDCDCCIKKKLKQDLARLKEVAPVGEPLIQSGHDGDEEASRGEAD